MEPDKRTAIQLGGVGHKMKGLPETAPLKDWNIIEASHIYDGPQGIHIVENADNNILMRNAVHVDNEKIIDESDTTIRPK